MIKKKLLRKGSTGLEGSLRNAEHHALPTVPLIKLLSSIIESYGDFDFTWEQGNNVHLVIREDGACLCFRPFSDKDSWGIDVLAKFSRSMEMRLVTICNVHEATAFGTFLGEFLLCPENLYGAKEHKNNSRAEV